MKRLTTDTPRDNFETSLNFVYGNNGWACIRSDGEYDGVPLTKWAKTQCLLRGCDELPQETDQEIDAAICECMMDCPECPVALAYCFASQAVHLRSRLKIYEDIMFDAEGQERITLNRLRDIASPPPNDPLTLEELREMDGEPVWIIPMRGSGGFRTWMLVDAEYELCREAHGEMAVFENCGKTWLAYRRRPEEGTV